VSSFACYFILSIVSLGRESGSFARRRVPQSIDDWMEPRRDGPPLPSPAALAPGAIVFGSHGAQYALRAQIHAGPRSDVWFADPLPSASASGGNGDVDGGDGDGASSSSPSSSPQHLPPPPAAVALKFVASKRRRASQNEADVMLQLTRCREATGPRGFAAPLLDAFEFGPSPLSSSSSSSLVVGRPDAGGGGALGGGAAARPAAASAPFLVLVTPAYGPPASAVVRAAGGLPERAVRRMARGLLRGLALMHGPRLRLAFLDLKPHNVVLEERGGRRRRLLTWQEAERPEPGLDGGAAAGGSGGRAGDGGGRGGGGGGAPESPPQPQRQARQRRHDDDPPGGKQKEQPLPRDTSTRWRLIDFGNASPLVRAGPWPLPALPKWLLPAAAPFGWRAARPPEYASPAYEAPESVLRLDGCPGAPADVWALGCVLFEAASGRPLFSPLVAGGGGDPGQENDSDSGGDADEDEDKGGEGGGGRRRQRRRWRRRVFSTAAEARLLSAVRATLGPAPLRVLRRSPVWRDYYDDTGEPLDAGGVGGGGAGGGGGRGGAGGSSRRRPASLEERVWRAVGGTGPGAWGPRRAAAFASFLRPMLEFDPDRRATAERMLRHAWLVSSSSEEEGDDDEQGGGGGREAGEGGGARRSSSSSLPQLIVQELS